MKAVTVNEFYLNFQKYVQIILKGENIILSSNKKIIALIEPLLKKTEKRPHGLCKGEFSVPKDFNKSLPENILGAFYR